MKDFDIHFWILDGESLLLGIVFHQLRRHLHTSEQKANAKINIGKQSQTKLFFNLPFPFFGRQEHFV